MIKYNRNEPLILIHVPKTAGSAVKVIYQKWFGNNFHTHYKKESTLPEKLDLFALHSYKEPLAIYGHFPSNRGFGIEAYYPEIKQFVAILREPYDMHLSRYFFLKKTTDNFKNNAHIKENCSLKEFLLEYHSQMLEHFPREVTYQNYKEIIENYFIEIGISEKLNESLEKIGKKLGFEYQNDTPTVNTTKREDQELETITEDVKQIFKENHSLEYLVYDYVCEKLG